MGDNLEEWDFDTQVFQLSQNFSLLLDVLTRMGQSFRKMSWIGFRNTLFLFLLKLLR